jgi:hypothetical protein
MSVTLARRLTVLVSAALAVVAVVAVDADALNASFLQNSPLTQVTPGDERALWSAVVDALETEAPDGSAHRWTNAPDGVIRKGQRAVLDARFSIEKSPSTADRECRKVPIALSARGQTVQWVNEVCRSIGGGATRSAWQLTLPSQGPARPTAAAPGRGPQAARPDGSHTAPAGE